MSDRQRVAEALRALKKKQRQNVLSKYEPYPWQAEFHKAGGENFERLLLAANGVGKTVCGAAETAFHATGLYPDWWEGRRFDRPVTWWVGSISNEQQRLGTQPTLLGADLSDNLGTGFIPGECLQDKIRVRQAGMADVADLVKVKHASGGTSVIHFKTYQQGWRIWQSGAPDGIWGDEQPDENESNERPIFAEMQTRVFRSGGILYFTLTPLLGETDMIRHFVEAIAEGIHTVGATWDDAPHLDKTQIKRLMETYPEHERETRAKGVPMMGEGRIFTTPEEDIRVPRFSVPRHYARIKGIDYGSDHPAAVAECAWDRDNDVFYVLRVWRQRRAEVEEHIEAISGDTPWVPISWPHDGLQTEKGSGRTLADSYRLVWPTIPLLSKSARFKNDVGGGQSTERAIMEIDAASRAGRFKVCDDCGEFFDEYRNYHRKDGKIVRKRDDVLSAVFYAWMMRRYARPEGMSAPQRTGMGAIVS